MTAARRVGAELLAAALFGVLAGVLKGDETGLRGQVGNLSAPWLLVGLLPAWGSRTLARGAGLGVVCTVTALVGFYAALTVVLAGHLGGGGFLRELAVEIEANRIYFVAGVITGPLFGAAGAWLGRRRRDTVWVVAGLLLAAEIGAVALLQGRQLAPPPLYFAWGVTDWTAYVAESLVGLAVVGVALWRRRSGAPAPG